MRGAGEADAGTIKFPMDSPGLKQARPQGREPFLDAKIRWLVFFDAADRWLQSGKDMVTHALHLQSMFVLKCHGVDFILVKKAARIQFG